MFLFLSFFYLGKGETGESGRKEGRSEREGEGLRGKGREEWGAC